MEFDLDLYQVGLVGHDPLDVLVRVGMLVEQSISLVGQPGLAAHGIGQRLDRQRLLRLGPRHRPAGAMRRRVVRGGVAQALDDEGVGPHRAGDHAPIALASTDGSLASDPQVLPVVVLPRRVVVVAVDSPHLLQRGRRHRGQVGEDRIHHCLPVPPRVVLGPEEVVEVRLELRLTLDEIGEVRVFERDEPLPHQALGAADVAHGQPVADAPAPGVKHYPHRVLGVEADLYEVVAGAERAELLASLRPQLRVVIDRRVGVGQTPGVAGELPVPATVAPPDTRRNRPLDER